MSAEKHREYREEAPLGLCGECGRTVYPSSASEKAAEEGKTMHGICHSGFPVEILGDFQDIAA
jgi:hypothetical protein